MTSPALATEVTEAIARFIVESRSSELPEDAVALTRAMLLDGLGTALAGSVEPTADMIRAYVRPLAGAPQATVIGSAFRTGAPDAALANGTLVHALDFDDSHFPGYFHPTSFLLPPVFALGEARNASGAEVAAAFAVGLHVGAAFAHGFNMHHYELGWHATATLGTFAATAASARLLGLDLGRCHNALSIAASTSAGVRQNFGTMTKPLHAGLASRNGVTAALLAEAGCTAATNAIEGRFGFANLYCGADQWQPDRLLGHLQGPFDATFSGVAFKKYPSCGATHRVLDTVIELIAQQPAVPAEIEAVECLVNPLSVNILIHDRPTTGLEGKFSLEYCVAVAVLDGHAGLAQFTDERAAAEDVQNLLRRVVKTPDPSVEWSGGNGPRVAIRLKNGRVISRQVSLPGSQPRDLLSEEERVAKFRDCASLALDPGRTEASLALVQRLEQLPSIRDLLQVVA